MTRWILYIYAFSTACLVSSQPIPVDTEKCSVSERVSDDTTTLMQLHLRKQSTEKRKTSEGKVARIIGGTKYNSDKQIQKMADILAEYDVVDWDGDAPRAPGGDVGWSFVNCITLKPTQGGSSAIETDKKCQPHQLPGKYPDGPNPWGEAENTEHYDIPTISMEQVHEATRIIDDAFHGEDWLQTMGDPDVGNYLKLAIANIMETSPKVVIWAYDPERGRDPTQWPKWVSLAEFVVMNRGVEASRSERPYRYHLIGRQGETIDPKGEPWWPLVGWYMSGDSD